MNKYWIAIILSLIELATVFGIIWISISIGKSVFPQKNWKIFQSEKALAKILITICLKAISNPNINKIESEQLMLQLLFWKVDSAGDSDKTDLTDCRWIEGYRVTIANFWKMPNRFFTFLLVFSQITYQYGNTNNSLVCIYYKTIVLCIVLTLF